MAYRNLKLGDTGKGAQGLQNALAQLGLLMPKYISGTFDEVTEHVITAFQRDYGLPITGVVDDETNKAICRELEKKG